LYLGPVGASSPPHEERIDRAVTASVNRNRLVLFILMRINLVTKLM